MNWIKTLTEDRVPEGTKTIVSVAGRDVLLTRHKGEVYATDSLCPHMRLPLQLGRVDGEGAIHCPWHRSAFDLQTGDVKAWAPWPPVVGPLLGKVSREKVLPTYPVKVEDGAIWIGMKEAEGE